MARKQAVAKKATAARKAAVAKIVPFAKQLEQRQNELVKTHQGLEDAQTAIENLDLSNAAIDDLRGILQEEIIDIEEALAAIDTLLDYFNS